MPRLPPRPCTYPRCKEYATKGSRCDEHQIKHNWHHRGNRHERGYGSKWDKIRKQVMVRDDHQCQECLRQGIYTKADEVDHIIPKHLGGPDSYDNLEAICKPCHAEKTSREAAEGRSR